MSKICNRQTNKKTFCSRTDVLHINVASVSEAYVFVFLIQACPVGPEYNILEPSGEQCKRLWLEQPIVSLWDMEVLRYTTHKGWKVSEDSYTASASSLY